MKRAKLTDQEEHIIQNLQLTLNLVHCNVNVGDAVQRLLFGLGCYPNITQV
jgi:hypothetical protein